MLPVHQNEKPTHIPSLDGIRAISVFLVLFSHAGLGHLFPGGLGVTIFFFLSGYLITHLLILEQRRNSYINFPHFYLRRFLRLFPPLLIVLVIAYVLCYSGFLGGGISWQGILSQLFYLANYHSVFNWPGEIPEGLGILWSLAVEEHFYLFFPYFFSILLKLERKIALILIAIICAVILGWRSYLVFFENVGNLRTYYATDTRIDSILYGSILAIAWDPAYLQENKSEHLSFKDLALICLSIMLMLLSLAVRSEQFRETVRYSIQGIALIPIFHLSIKKNTHFLFKWLNWSWIKKLGVYSYFIYLIHLVLIKFIQKNYNVTIVNLILITSILAIIFSYFIDTYIDVYFAKARKKFRD